jgi:GTP pyrophosphokinase
MTVAIARTKDEMLAHPSPLAEGIDEYLSFSVYFAKAYANRRITLARMLREVSSLARDHAPGAELQGRVKSILSIRYKMRASRVRDERVLDSIGIRIVLPRTRDCYRLVERLHREFEIVAGEYDDYIERPKPSGYRSLHTTIISPNGHTVEIQVRTRWMHALAEQGAAAHWRYKQRKALAEVQAAAD